jgi:hypothetical protein
MNAAGRRERPFYDNAVLEEFRAGRRRSTTAWETPRLKEFDMPIHWRLGEVTERIWKPSRSRRDAYRERIACAANAGPVPAAKWEARPAATADLSGNAFGIGRELFGAFRAAAALGHGA